MKHLLSKGILIVCMAAALSGCHESKEALDLRKQAVELINAGEYEQAVDMFNQALNNGDGFVDDFEKDILRYKAEAELRMGDYKAAVSSYETIIDVEGESKELLGFLAIARSRAGDIEGSIEALSRCGKTDTAINSGNIVAADLIEKGELDSAEAVLNGLLGFVEEDKAEALVYNLIVIREKRGDFAGALNALTDYAAKYGTNEDIDKEIAFLKSRI